MAAVTVMPMFPLGAVLFPYLPLQLRVFEERYLVMMARVLDGAVPEFGVVLIESGLEVGGGDDRFDIGTVAQIVELTATEGYLTVTAQGQRRFQITEWLPDDPNPRAVIQPIDDLQWDDSLEADFERTERIVRRGLAVASEYLDNQWPADTELADDRAIASWQLAGMAPLSELDRVALLRATSFAQLLAFTAEFTEVAVELMRSLGEDEDEDEELGAD